MFVAVWRYPTALSLALGAGLLAQPALAHGHYRHHAASSLTAHHYARSYGRRHATFVTAPPRGWGEQTAATMSVSSWSGGPARRSRHRVVAESWQAASWQSESGPQNYWQHGWRGHARQQTAWQQNGWQQTAWQQDNWQRGSARQRRLAQRQQAAFFGGATPGATSTYYDYAASNYAAQSSSSSFGGGFGGHSELSGMIAQAASSAGVPLSLAERVVRRESGGNPRAVHAGNYGLMQIRLGTARAMGYGGSAAGLLDPSVNMTYAMRYLAGAYRAAGGSESRAVALYARGYHATPARVQTYTF